MRQAPPILKNIHMHTRMRARAHTPQPERSGVAGMLQDHAVNPLSASLADILESLADYFDPTP